MFLNSVWELSLECNHKRFCIKQGACFGSNPAFLQVGGGVRLWKDTAFGVPQLGIEIF